MSKANIQFNYLYRDAGNYKAFASQVFSNPDNLGLEDVEMKIRSALIDEQFFEPSKWGIKRLKIAEWDDALDHLWHEFRSVERTSKVSTVPIGQFLERINRTNQTEWAIH